MTKLSLLGVLAFLLLLLAPAQAQEAPTEWQDVISSQIQAFRDHDSPAALSFAGASFKQSFADPEQFYRAILDWGYAPIMESRAHSFGPYELVQADVVLQSVRFTGTDQSLYEAVYRLNREPEGWRVGGVELAKAPGVGV